VFSGIPGKSQSLLKVFTFECFRESIKFSYMFIEMAQVITHHPVFYVNWDEVTINLHTWASHNLISDFDLRCAVIIDQLYYHVVQDDL
jgi:pterin-4a-carbinolamine dehydratase